MGVELASFQTCLENNNMGPCNILYISEECNQEIEHFMFEVKGVQSHTKKGNQWMLSTDSFVYEIIRTKEDIDDIGAEIENLPYDAIDKDVYSITICAPSKKKECISFIDHFTAELTAFLRSKGGIVFF